MKKLWLFGTFLAISTLAGCGGNFFTPPGTPYQKVKTAFSGVENSFKKVSTSRSRVPQKKLLWQDSSSTLDSLFSLYASEDNYGDVLEDLSYTEPPMIQFQCLKYAFDKIGEGYSFGTKYYDTVTGKVYVDVETGAEAEQTSAYEWNYNFLLALDINIDSNDLITADVSFGITISKGSDSYHADWYVNMILDYDMEKENPTYTLTMLTNNDERNIPYFNRCTYEYDYVNVKEGAIKEWRKFDLEASVPVSKDAAHPTFDSYLNGDITYKVGSFDWYKNNSFYKAKNIERETNRKQRVANLFFDMGLNATDIDGTLFFAKQGTQNNVIQTMYQEFSNTFRKDIIYSLVISHEAEGREEQTPRYLQITNSRREGESILDENDECYLGNGNATIADLVSGQAAYAGQSQFIPHLRLLNSKEKYIRDATPDDLSVKAVISEENLVPLAMNSKIVDTVNRYHLPVIKLEISLVDKDQVLDSKRISINCSVFSNAIKGWPFELLETMGLDGLVPPITSKNFDASAEILSQSTNPIGCAISLNGVDENDINSYEAKLQNMGYPLIYKNPTYAIPDTERGIVFGLEVGNTLRIEQNYEFNCAYSQADKAIFSALNQDVLLPEGLVFNHPNNLADTFDYYGVSTETLNAFINKLTGHSWQKNNETPSEYKYYLDANGVRYCIAYENVSENCTRVSYFTGNIPSSDFAFAELFIKDEGSLTLGGDTEGNLYVDVYFRANQEFYIVGYDRSGHVLATLGFNELQHNAVADEYLAEGKQNNILVLKEETLRIRVVYLEGSPKIACSLWSEEQAPEHSYSLVGEFNNWNPKEGTPLTYNPEDGTFFLREYQFSNGQGFVILQDGKWDVYYGFSHLGWDYSDFVAEGQDNAIVPIVNFTATLFFMDGVINFVSPYANA